MPFEGTTVIMTGGASGLGASSRITGQLLGVNDDRRT